MKGKRSKWSSTNVRETRKNKDAGKSKSTQIRLYCQNKNYKQVKFYTLEDSYKIEKYKV